MRRPLRSTPRTALATNSGPFQTGCGQESTQDEEIRQHIDHIDGLELAGDPDRQAFVGELVDHIEHSVFASCVGAVLDEVIGPDVIAVLGTQPDT